MRARLAAIPAVVLSAGVSPLWTCGLFTAPPDAAPPPIGADNGHPGTGHGSETIGEPVGSNIPTSPPYKLGHREEVVLPGRHPTPAPEPPPLRIPDAQLVHALNIGQPAFLGCFHRAQRADSTLVSAKINVHLFVDTSGSVMSASTDVTDPKLSRCLINIAKRMRFPAPSGLAVADLTFFAS